MSEHEPLTPGERELEEAMSRLRPSSATRLDPLAIAFDAGRSTLRPSLAAWRAISASLLVALLAVVVIPRDPSRPVDRLVQSSTGSNMASPADHAQPQLATYYAMRNDVLSQGVAALPTAPSASGPVGQPIRAGEIYKF